MKYKAIIFDMDGTIIDTEMVWVGAAKAILKSKNIQLSAHEATALLHQATGMSVYDSCALLKQYANLEESVQELSDELLGYAKELYQHGMRFIPGFVDFHANAQRHGLKMGIATNADNHTLHVARTTLNLEAFFGTHIYNPPMVNHRYKPEPDLYLHVALQLEIDPKECIAIEDSATGIVAARAAGMFCIGIGTSQDPHQIKNSHLPVAGYEHINLIDLLEIPLSDPQLIL